MSGTSGFEYYLQRSALERGRSLPRVPLKLLSTLQESNGNMKILDLAASGGMEIFVFMDAVRQMQDDGLVSLQGASGDPENIEIQITQVGRTVVALSTS